MIYKTPTRVYLQKEDLRYLRLEENCWTSKTADKINVVVQADILGPTILAEWGEDEDCSS